MSLLFIDSFDHYATANIIEKYDGIGGTPAIVPLGRCNTNCLQTELGDTVTKGVAAVGDTVIIGFAIKHTSGSSNPVLFTVRGGPLPIFTVFHASDGSIYANYNPDAAFPPRSFISYGGLLPHNEFHYFEMKIVLGNPGSVDIQVDGVLVYSNPSCTTSTDGSTWTGISLHSSLFSTTMLFDDFYLADADGAAPWNDFLGDVRVEFLRPVANGDVQEWDNPTGPSHWEAVDDDDTPDDDASYISTSVIGRVEVNEHEDSVLPAGGEVFGVQVSMLAKKDQPGDREIAPVFRQGSTNYTGDSAGVTQDAYSYTTVMAQENPATAAQWTITEINDTQYGVKVIV